VGSTFSNVYEIENMFRGFGGHVMWDDIRGTI
jgi:N12 class adenine-specific DNA methylase